MQQAIILSHLKNKILNFYSILLKLTTAWCLSCSHSCQIWRFCATKRACWGFDDYLNLVIVVPMTLSSIWRFCATKRACWGNDDYLNLVIVVGMTLSSIWRFCATKRACWGLDDYLNLVIVVPMTLSPNEPNLTFFGQFLYFNCWLMSGVLCLLLPDLTILCSKKNISTIWRFRSLFQLFFEIFWFLKIKHIRHLLYFITLNSN